MRKDHLIWNRKVVCGATGVHIGGVMAIDAVRFAESNNQCKRCAAKAEKLRQKFPASFVRVTDNYTAHIQEYYWFRYLANHCSVKADDAYNDSRAYATHGVSFVESIRRIAAVC